MVGFELNSQNPEEAAAFYSKVFGWEIAARNWDFWAVMTGTKKKLGLMKVLVKDQVISTWYMDSNWSGDAIDEIIAQAKNNGATILRERMEFNDLYLAYLFGRSNRHRNRFNSI